MKKNITYLVIIFLIMFLGINRVDAATEMACKYNIGDNYYIYLSQDSSGNHSISKMLIDGKNLYAWSDIKISGNLNSFSTCPKYVRHDGDNKFVFSGSKTWNHLDYEVTKDSPITNSSYSTWDCSYSFGETDKYSVTLSQNKFGLVSANVIKNSKAVENQKMLFYGFNFGNSTCSSYVASNAYLSSSDKMVFYNEIPSGASESGYIACTGSGCLKDSNSSVIPENEKCNSKGENCEYTNLDSSDKKVCIYENAGYCSSRCLGDYCSPNASECNSGATDANSRFRNSSYMLLSANAATGKISEIYLPKMNSNNSIISERIAAYRFRGATASYLAESFDEFKATSISVAQSWNDADEKVIASGKCPEWFNNTDGKNAYEYDTETYFWKRIDIKLEDLDGDHSDTPGGMVDPGDYTAGNGTYYCKYNDGNMIMKVSIRDSNSNISLYFPNNADLGSAFYSYEIGKGTEEPISWISKDGKYGDVESANDGSFEDILLSAQSDNKCPAQVNYGADNGSLTICYTEDDCKDVGGYAGKNPKFFVDDSSSDDNQIDINSCEDLISPDLRKTLNEYFLIFRIIVPILVIVLGTVDFGKAIFAGKEDDMKKSQNSFIKRIVIAVAIFLIPTFVNILMDVANRVWGWNSDTCEVEKIDLSD